MATPTTPMSDINKALNALAAQVLKLDLTKENEKSKIEGMEKGITGGAESITKMEDFGEEHLTSLEGILKTANGKAEQYDPNAEIEKETQAYLNGKNDEAKKIREVRTARQDAAKNINEMKERFSKQAKVIEIYGKLWNQKILEDRLKARTDANTRKIEENNKKLDAIRDFENRDDVKKQIEIIQKSIEIQKDLKSLEEEIQQIEKHEARISTAPTDGVSPEAIDNMKKRVKGEKEGLKGKTDTIATKYGITLDTTDISNLKQQIGAAKVDWEQKSKTARDEILKLAKNPKEDAYIKGDLYAKLKATSKPEDIMKVFGNERHRIGTENVDLQNKNTAISGTKTTLELGRTTLATGYTAPTIAEPTADEIQQQIDADSTLKNALANVLSPEDRQQKVYEWLLNEKGKQPGFHPILSWQAKHSKKAIEQWENQYNKATMEEATSRAKAKKQQDAANAPEAEAAEKSQRTKSDFIKSLLHHTMKANDAQLEKMLKDAEKGKFGDTLDSVYSELEDKEYDEAK